MAFYKYGLTFLAGTGFGAAVTSLRNDGCPLRRQHCRQHQHRCDDAAAAGLPGKGESDGEYYDPREMKDKNGSRRCPKKGGGEEKNGDHQISYDKEEASD